MYYGSGTVDIIAAGARRTLREHSPDNSTLCQMTSWPTSLKYNVLSEIRLRQSMRMYLLNIPAKFHPDPIWNDKA